MYHATKCVWNTGKLKRVPGSSGKSLKQPEFLFFIDCPARGFNEAYAPVGADPFLHTLTCFVSDCVFRVGAWNSRTREPCNRHRNLGGNYSLITLRLSQSSFCKQAVLMDQCGAGMSHQARADQTAPRPFITPLAQMRLCPWVETCCQVTLKARTKSCRPPRTPRHFG